MNFDLDTIVRSVSIVLLLALVVLLVRRFPRKDGRNWWEDDSNVKNQARFNPPPGWPPAPPGWVPPPGWEPDPDWPPAPPGWEFWTR